MRALLQAAIPRLVSPSTVSPVPRLETEFLDHWAGALDSSELISQEYRGILKDLVKTKAPLSVFADALSFGLAEGWILAQGRGDIRYSWHGVEQVFKPFPISRNEPSYYQSTPPIRSGRPINRDEILNMFTEYDPKGDLQANKVLEFSYPAPLFQRGVDVIESCISSDCNLRPNGLFFYFRTSASNNSDCTITARITSLSFMVSALHCCFGDQAVIPCPAKGEISSLDTRDLHKEGYHSVGFKDFPFVCHDLNHIVNWSGESVEKRGYEWLT
jgi:hypothetical protein